MAKHYDQLDVRFRPREDSRSASNWPKNLRGLERSIGQNST